MTKVHAYAATEVNGTLEPFEYELGPIGPYEVDIAVEHCGICHSDLSMLENAWGMTEFPFVPGHEVAGTIKAVGAQVTHLAVGDHVGLGWHAGYCMTCRQCLSGDHNMCASAAGTIVGRHGGFADVVRAQAPSVVKLPAGVASRTAGPLFCGGITVFNPLVQFGLSPTGSVGVIGIGGLGHMALSFARAWGCHVTAFTSSESKKKEALAMGAHDTINSRDLAALESAAGRFDLLLSTVNVKLDWNTYVNTLAPRGRLHILGATLEPLDLAAFPLIFAQRSVSGSPVGSPATIGRMLDFCARHQIAPTTEHYPMSKVNEALDHLRAGRARYRIVLDCD
ncbi:MAG: NAD(P)-dependent alcohol dehydrogenase [Phycisphaerales bacterium]|nr:NAD(P)-dependent alcohol dehydrogenase [Phycisphaerales bacterium]